MLLFLKKKAARLRKQKTSVNLGHGRYKIPAAGIQKFFGRPGARRSFSKSGGSLDLS
jgi:hypothetical protein